MRTARCTSAARLIVTLILRHHVRPNLINHQSQPIAEPYTGGYSPDLSKLLIHFQPVRPFVRYHHGPGHTERAAFTRPDYGRSSRTSSSGANHLSNIVLVNLCRGVTGG